MIRFGKRPSNHEREQAIIESVSYLRQWSIPADAVDRVHDAARASLNEVKSLTEYEDGKVSRLLTIIAFLSAVVGAVFTRLAADYAWPTFGRFAWSWAWLLPAAAYLSFFIYIILVTWSVMTVLGGIRPIFNAPASWTGHGKPGLPPSMLFYKGILDVSALKWAEAFEQLTGSNGLELKQYYAKCYVAEAYLVAEKVADKLQIVSPGINMLRLAMAVLLMFFAFFSATIVAVDPTRPGLTAPVSVSRPNAAP